jgi:hypothetical protein
VYCPEGLYASLFISPPVAPGSASGASQNDTRYIFVAANDANVSRAATITISGLQHNRGSSAPLLRVREAVACVLDQRGDLKEQTMDTAKLVNVTVALSATNGGLSFDVELEGDSTLTVVMDEQQ